MLWSKKKLQQMKGNHGLGGNQAEACALSNGEDAQPQPHAFRCHSSEGSAFIPKVSKQAH
jgi:hypothetical protein